MRYWSTLSNRLKSILEYNSDRECAEIAGAVRKRFWTHRRKLLTPVLVLLILLIFSEEQGCVVAAEPERVA